MARYLVEIVIECEDDEDIKNFEYILEDETTEKLKISVLNIEEIDD